MKTEPVGSTSGRHKLNGKGSFLNQKGRTKTVVLPIVIVQNIKIYLNTVFVLFKLVFNGFTTTMSLENDKKTNKY